MADLENESSNDLGGTPTNTTGTWNTLRSMDVEVPNEIPNYLSQYKHFPWFICVTALTQVSVFFVYVAIDNNDSLSMTTPLAGPSECYMRITSGLPECRDLRPEVWRLVCSQFVHKGLAHLLSNEIMFLVIGIPLEMVHRWRIAVLYTTGVIMGNLSNIVLHPSKWLVGASGGVYSLLGVHVINMYMNWSEMPYRWVRLIFLSGMTVIDLVSYHFYYVDGVAYMAHFGGWVSGILGGSMLLRNLKWRTHELVTVGVMGSLYVIWLSSVLTWYIGYVYPGRPFLKEEHEGSCA